MTDSADLDVLATIANLAGEGQSTDVAAVVAALEAVESSDGVDAGAIAATLGRLSADSLLDIEGEAPAAAPPGEDATLPDAWAALTVTPLGWATLVPDAPT